MKLVPTGPVIRRRIAMCMGLFFLLFLGLSTRLFVLTVIDSEALQAKAQSQWTTEAVIQARRGAILDRNGEVLAMSATAYTLSVSPRQVKNSEALARLLSPVIGVDAETIRRRASDTTKGGVTLKRQLPYAATQQLKLMMADGAQRKTHELDGLYLEQDSKRYYPYGAFLTQLLGLTTIDGVGQAGLEQSLNNYLSGRSGRIVKEIDGKGRALNISSGEYVQALEGGSAVLTIDATIQGYCEKAAREAMEVNRAESVRILAMNPKTGEILAMVNKPDYDPNDPPRNDIQTLTERMRNRLITDAYEPGSTFKMITMSAALEEKLTNRSEWFYCSGSVYVEGGRIRCWGRPHGSESLTQALENSCNPVFVELGLRLGTDRFYKYLNAYGFGQKTGVDIPGEGSGIVIGKSAVKRVDIARIGFGQSIAVTPVQLLTAACAVVNGGKLMTPYVVKEIRDADGNVIERGKPTVRATPISEGTSKIMREMLESVVKNGGGKNAYIDGYHIGGKTGTAQVYIDGVVSSDTHIGSFIGFAPMDDPQIALMVIIDRAERRPDYGSTTAAPFARDILLQTLAYLKVPRESAAGADEATTVPNVSGDTLNQAIKSLKAEGLGYMLSGAGARVRDQMPEPGAEMTKGSVVMLYMDGDAEVDADAWIEVPDVKGKSVMEVNQTLISCGLRLKLSGSGIACSQSPEAGEYVFPDAVVDVTFAFPGEE